MKKDSTCKMKQLDMEYVFLDRLQAVGVGPRAPCAHDSARLPEMIVCDKDHVTPIT